FRDPFLAARTLLPVGLRAFISADMDVGRRKDGKYLIHDILQEHKGRVFAGTIYIVENAPGLFNLVRTSSFAAQPWVSGKGSRGVARHFYFRNYGNMPVGGILYNFPGLFL